jgi:hypothetical protein
MMCYRVSCACCFSSFVVLSLGLSFCSFERNSVASSLVQFKLPSLGLPSCLSQRNSLASSLVQSKLFSSMLELLPGPRLETAFFNRSLTVVVEFFNVVLSFGRNLGFAMVTRALRTWLKALPNFLWVGLPAAALVGEPEAGALSILFEERVMVDFHLWCELWKDEC